MTLGLARRLLPRSDFELSVGLERHLVAVLKIPNFVNCVQSELSAWDALDWAMGKFVNMQVSGRHSISRRLDHVGHRL
jgi:hypothetical protein